MSVTTAFVGNIEALQDEKIYPLNDKIGVKKVTMSMYISPDNTLPWAFVEGNVNNPVEGYPVIIQIIKTGVEPKVDGNQGRLNDARFAQVDLREDNSYEYRFRVLDNSLDKPHLYIGEYTVNVYKVVQLPENFAKVG